MPELPRELLSTPDAAQRLGVTDSTIRNQIRAGKLRGYRVGRNFKVAPADLDVFIERYEPAGGAK
jgi:excisionase family DNA binding protein